MTKFKTLVAGGIAVTLVASLALADVALAHGKKSGDRAGRGPMMEQIFAEMDADGDGKVTRAEIEAHIAARFAAADGNGDGKLSAEELAAAREARKADRTARMIERLDTDGDGLLSAEELAQRDGRRGPLDMLDRLDADGDGALTLEEVQAMRGKHGGHRHGKLPKGTSDDG